MNQMPNITWVEVPNSFGRIVTGPEADTVAASKGRRVETTYEQLAAAVAGGTFPALEGLEP